jgi:hypothetical protein
MARKRRRKHNPKEVRVGSGSGSADRTGKKDLAKNALVQALRTWDPDSVRTALLEVAGLGRKFHAQVVDAAIEEVDGDSGLYGDTFREALVGVSDLAWKLPGGDGDSEHKAQEEAARKAAEEAKHRMQEEAAAEAARKAAEDAKPELRPTVPGYFDSFESSGGERYAGRSSIEFGQQSVTLRGGDEGFESIETDRETGEQICWLTGDPFRGNVWEGQTVLEVTPPGESDMHYGVIFRGRNEDHEGECRFEIRFPGHPDRNCDVLADIPSLASDDAAHRAVLLRVCREAITEETESESVDEDNSDDDDTPEFEPDGLETRLRALFPDDTVFDLYRPFDQWEATGKRPDDSPSTGLLQIRRPDPSSDSDGHGEVLFEFRRVKPSHQDGGFGASDKLMFLVTIGGLGEGSHYYVETIEEVIDLVRQVENYKGISDVANFVEAKGRKLPEVNAVAIGYLCDPTDEIWTQYTKYPHSPKLEHGALVAEVRSEKFSYCCFEVRVFKPNGEFPHKFLLVPLGVDSVDPIEIDSHNREGELIFFQDNPHKSWNGLLSDTFREKSGKANLAATLTTPALTEHDVTWYVATPFPHSRKIGGIVFEARVNGSAVLKVVSARVKGGINNIGFEVIDVSGDEEVAIDTVNDIAAIARLAERHFAEKAESSATPEEAEFQVPDPRLEVVGEPDPSKLTLNHSGPTQYARFRTAESGGDIAFEIWIGPGASCAPGRAFIIEGSGKYSDVRPNGYTYGFPDEFETMVRACGAAVDKVEGERPALERELNDPILAEHDLFWDIPSGVSSLDDLPAVSGHNDRFQDGIRISCCMREREEAYSLGDPFIAVYALDPPEGRKLFLHGYHSGPIEIQNVDDILRITKEMAVNYLS